MMDQINYFVDRLWDFIEIYLDKITLFMDKIISPLDVLGPGVVIFILAFVTVIFTRIMAKFYVTKRYIQLEKEYEHWKALRDEALKHDDREKGKRLARNIDSAKLNQAFYDYFIEGFLKNIITNVLPILLMLAYVMKAYSPAELADRFNRQYVFFINTGGSTPMPIGTMFWFVISVLCSFIIFSGFKMAYKKLLGKPLEEETNKNSEETININSEEKIDNNSKAISSTQEKT